ncbi:DUF6880 family protein [Sulfitobacter sp. S190]|uniref:DUF6880 family protein n=1 Tax=Sulfitobacter sp. S190 TaxID=2867022 RepID=UPI0021A61A86|nr:DUF6880 family protein [Sulfitobacter sp. S190]UWR21198.1 hypothetical protein K3756_10765 [Sulfitobacter sp. S190]
MSRKTLNKDNLVALGPDRLADLLLEVSTGSADIKRRLRLELSHNLGASELAHEVRKRLAALRKSKTYVSWRRRKSLVTDLTTQMTMIVEKIAADDPDVAFDLLWQFMELAPFIFARADDRRGDIGAVFSVAVQHFENIAPRAAQDTDTLADRVWTALSEDDHGVLDDIIGLLAPTLGQAGLARLKAHVQNFAAAPATQQDADHDAIRFLRDLRGERDYRAELKARFVRKCLREIAEVTGDTNAYIAQFTPEDLQSKAVAAEVATLLLDDNASEQALAVLNSADASEGTLGQTAWDNAMIRALTALDRPVEAQTHRWSCFERDLSVHHLREYLRALPDFEDVEAEDRARRYILSYPAVLPALRFCLDWPDLLTASQLVLDRAHEIDGEDYTFVNHAADTLRDRYPLAATLLLRSMIDFAIRQRRTARYKHVAGHLQDCEGLDARISDYGAHPSHNAYVDMLRGHEEFSRLISGTGG